MAPASEVGEVLPGGTAAPAGEAMIRVRGLCMRYGRQEVLRDVSFTVRKGEVVGLLGPNGAGKTTTMRILSCFVAATEGTGEIAGASLTGDTLAVRRAIGYLPEASPLYPDMRVEEYLAFRAALRGVPRPRRRAALDRALDQCALGARRRQIIGTLSRGYRQRVGLADALVADPPVLILDEPTAGLDPNQMRDLRALIRGLAGAHTILLSTHILPEVEAVADRVVVMNGGRVIADATPADLRGGGAGRGRLLVEVRPQDASAAEAVLRAAPGVVGLTVLSPARFALEVAPDRDARDDVFAAVAAAGLGLRELRADTLSLEEVFARITTAEPASGHVLAPAAPEPGTRRNDSSGGGAPPPGPAA